MIEKLIIYSRQALHLLLFILLLTTGAHAQSFSEFQSAKMLQPRGVEATANFSSISSTIDGESSHLQNHFGLRAAVGINDKMNLRVNYEHIFDSDIDGINVLMIGSKSPVIADWIAFYVPLSVAFGSGVTTSETWQLQPSALFTVSFTENIEFNPSVKWIVPFSSNQENLVAVNIGAGFSSNLSQWAVRPEFSLLYDPGSDGHLTHYGIALSYYPFFEDDCCPQKLRRNR